MWSAPLSGNHVILAHRACLFPLVLAIGACGSDGASLATSAASVASASASSVGPVPSALSPAAPGAKVTASLDAGGVSFSVSGKKVGTGCAGDQGVTVPVQSGGAPDFAVVSACARTLKADPKLADQTAMTVSAAPETRYGDVIALLDATRSDARGDLFPDVQFGIPRTATSAAPSAAPRALPVTPLDPVAADQIEEGVILRISKTQITVGDDPNSVVSYPDLESVRAHGLDAKHKRAGQNDVFIVPLARVLESYRATDKRIREAKGVDASTSELILVADENVPYRVLVEVLFTAGEAEFGKYHLLVRSGAR